jgi:molybdate transport system ATP-binding protein
MSVEVSIRHSFGTFALDVAFQARSASVTALFGPSGAGKTSIVNAIAGLLTPREGTIIIGGRVVLDTAAGICLSARARRVGYVFQDSRLFPHMSVRDNLLFGWRRAPAKASESEIANVIELLGLAHLLDRFPRALSGGEKSRVALGRSLLSSPDILLLDEPLAALDQARRAEILPYLERLRDEAKLPMLYVSHAVDEVARMADEIVVLKDGRVAAQGSVFDLLTALDGPAGIDAVGAVLDSTVVEHRVSEGLSVLSFDGGTLIVSRVDHALGKKLRVRIRSEDIMLAREEPRAISANNVLAATVSAVRFAQGQQADVQLACSNTKLVARITRASVARLGLEPGVPVFAIVKSVTVDSQ